MTNKLKAILKANGIEIAKTHKGKITTRTIGNGVTVWTQCGVTFISARGYGKETIQAIIEKSGFEGRYHVQ